MTKIEKLQRNNQHENLDRTTCEALGAPQRLFYGRLYGHNEPEYEMRQDDVGCVGVVTVVPRTPMRSACTGLVVAGSISFELAVALTDLGC